MRLPGVAPGLPPWRGDTLLLNYNREIKRARSTTCRAPGPRHFNKEQTPLGDLLRSQPAVSRRLFRCLGAHLLRSPLIVKSSADTLARFLATAGQNPSVESLGSPTPQTVWCLLASSRPVRRSRTHRAKADAALLSVTVLRLSFLVSLARSSHSWAIKNPASDSVSRVGKSRMSFRVTCLP